MGCVQSYFKRAQTSLSPSSTHDSERKPLDDGSPIHEITRQPISCIREESEDRGDTYQDEDGNNNTEGGERKNSLHCVGVEATAVRQLAASTGTVAILGTTAKVGMKKSASGNIIEEETPDENADVVEVVIEHNKILPSNSGPLHQTIEAIAKEVRTDLMKNGFHQPLADSEVKFNDTALPSDSTNKTFASGDQNTKVEDIEVGQNNVGNDGNNKIHINPELLNNISKDISISQQKNTLDNVIVAPSNLDNQVLNSEEIVTNHIEPKTLESNIENYDSIAKGPSLEPQYISEEIKEDKTDQINTNFNNETRTNNSSLDKQTKVPLAKHFKQEVNTSEVITKQKSRSSKESSLERDLTNSLDRDQSIECNKTDLTSVSKIPSVDTYSEKATLPQSQVVNNISLTKLPSIDNKTVSETVDEIIQSATNIVLEKSKTKLIEKSPTEPEIFDTESKKSMSHDLDTDSNETSDQTVISQESLNEEHIRDGVTSVLIIKNKTNKSIDHDKGNENDNVENDYIPNGELKDHIMKEEITPEINVIIQAAEEHVNAFNEQLNKVVENGVPDEDSLTSKNSFDKDETTKESAEKDDVFDMEPMKKSFEGKLPENLETLPKKVLKKGLSLSLTSQTDESSIEISPENDVSNTVSETSEATKDIFTPRSGTSMHTPQDDTPLSEEQTPRDFPLSDSMMDNIKRQVDEICDEAVNRINTATTKIQAGYRGYKTRKSLKQSNTDGGAQSFDGADLPPPDLERLGSIHEDDMPRPPDEVPDFDQDPDFPLPPPSDSLSESLSSAATKIQAGVRGYLTRKQVKQGSSTTVPSDSDFSETSVTSQDPIRTSTDLETQVQRLSDPVKPFRGKRMSLDSNMKQTRPFRPPLRSVMSERDDDEDPQEIWRKLTQEADKAAVLIQSSFRGYKARKKLSRGDAVHMPTTSSSATPSSARSEEPVTISQRGTGEFHDAVFDSETMKKIAQDCKTRMPKQNRKTLRGSRKKRGKKGRR